MKNEKGPWFKCHCPEAMFRCLKKKKKLQQHGRKRDLIQGVAEAEADLGLELLGSGFWLGVPRASQSCPVLSLAAAAWAACTVSSLSWQSGRDNGLSAFKSV